MCARALNPWCESLELHMQEESAFCPKREISTLDGALFAFSAGPAAAICAWGWSVMKRSRSLLSSCSSLRSVDVINHHDQSTLRRVVSCYVLQPAQKGSWGRKLEIGTKAEAMKTARSLVPIAQCALLYKCPKVPQPSADWDLPHRSQVRKTPLQICLQTSFLIESPSI